MKKIVLLGLISIFLIGCSVSRQQPNYGKLRIGMSMHQVENLIGPPERVISLTRTAYGYEEIWQYRTVHNEVFALEFLNEVLEGYQFLYEDYRYVPSPNYYRPPHGRPIFPNYKPNRPIYRPTPSRPNQPPSNSQHPNYRPPRPESTSPSRPGGSSGVRPGNNQNTNSGRETGTRDSQPNNSHEPPRQNTNTNSSGTNTRGSSREDTNNSGTTTRGSSREDTNNSGTGTRNSSRDNTNNSGSGTSSGGRR